MTLKDQLELTQKAVDNNALKELFLGAPDYDWGNLKHIPSNVATDIGAIIDEGIYKLYNNGNTCVSNKLVTTIYELLSLDQPFAIWTAYFILRYQYRNELKGKSPFKIVTPSICKHLADVIETHKSSLAACNDYVGYGLHNGLWEDIQRLEKVLLNNYGVSIL